jgi:hypothetical protein
MPSTKSTPTHLSIFAADPETGHPVTRLPLYAEVAVPRITPPVLINDRFDQPLRAAVITVDPTASGALQNQVVKTAQEVLAENVAEASRNHLVLNPTEVRDLFQNVLKDMLVTAGAEHLADIPQAELKQQMAAALRRIADNFDVELVPAVEDKGVIWAEPLGVLTTDHVGYASWDLRRLRPEVQILLADAIEARRKDPNADLKLAIWIYPYGHAKKFDALSQARFALDAIVTRLPLQWNTLPPALINMGPQALQNPSLTDWRLSPASFAASPKALLDEDGCEQLIPSNLALQQFVLRQVVRLTDLPAGFTVPAGFKAAYIDDYKVSWYSLGHSLGEILYSLPLAPGETVKLAVIDWSWDSLTRRDETTKLFENILHQTHRDRTITETVNAALKEFQGGSSFMAGMANSVGGSGGANLGVVGLGAATGNTLAVGGSISSTEGSRFLAAENIQRLSDNFTQASSAQRELNSTVVIQARQEEKESIQTRTFSNFNHSHTLTILYYEVLRHYRVTVEWVRRRQAVLVKMPPKLPGALTANMLLNRRYLLEPFLRNPKLGAAFDAAARFALGQEKLKRETDKWTATTQTIEPGAKSFVKLIAQFTTTSDDTSEPVFVVLHLHDGRVFEFQCDGAGDEGTSPEFEKMLPVPIAWNQIKGIEVKLKDINSGGDWEESNILITMATATNERTSILADAGTRTLDDAGGTTGLLLSIQPPPATTTTVGPQPQRADFISAEDDLALGSLIAHIATNRSYYNSVMMLSTDPNTIAIEFESKPWTAGQMMADHVEPTPLEVFGSYIAFGLAKQPPGIDDSLIVDIAAALNGNDPARRQAALDQIAAMTEADRQKVLERLPLASAKSERLITLPTRGIFGEGKLGHCNVSEEIDNTRFWKWEEHPFPEAPDIAPVTPVTPQPQQITAAPTPFPQSLVNIVNPTAAPDPTGLGAALTLLGTPNIFRDMSGRAEVADLLKKLSDNSIKIAEAANRAREIQAKYGTDLDKHQREQETEIFKAAADVEGKAVQAEAQRAAQAQASKKEAEAKVADVQAARQQAEAAKDFPKPLREPILKDAANAAAGNPVKNKVVVFKAVGYNGQVLEGEFGLAVRDVTGQKDIIQEPKIGPYFDKAVSFSDPAPVIEARARRTSASQIKIFDDIITLPAIDVVPSSDKSYTAGKSHKVINLTLTQASKDVQFKATSTNEAVDELMNKWGVELGVNKVVAGKLIADYEKKHNIKHTTTEEKSYSINVPTQNYQLVVTSH